MRDDPSKTKTFKDLDLWDRQKYVNKVMVPYEHDPNSRTLPTYKFTSHSLSGNERNRVFFQQGDNFSDVTLISGADDMADGRSCAFVDFDGDGWQDIALMSLNAPRFKLYRNEMGKYSDNGRLRFRLVGGNSEAAESTEFSNRDAVGSRVLVEFKSGKKVLLQKQAGEGFSSQNSEVLSIGIPKDDEVVSLSINWPSGKTTEVDSPSQTEIFTINEKEPASQPE